MDSMFLGAKAYNQPLESWNVARVTRMGMAFHKASSFNQPLGAWDVSEVCQPAALLGTPFTAPYLHLFR